MTVWMFIDPFASGVADDKAEAWNAEHPEGPEKSATDIEYEEIEEAFTKTFPKERILFSRGKMPRELANASPNYYVWDIGGLCYTDYSGTQRGDFSRVVIDQIKEHPDTVFVPWSRFTQQYAEGALADLFGDDAFVEKKLPPNVIILDNDQTIWVEEEIIKELKKLYRARGKKKQK